MSNQEKDNIMVTGEFLSITRKLAMKSVSQMDLPTGDLEYVYNMNTLMDYDITQAVKKTVRMLKTFFAGINDKEAVNTALYATYFELKKKNNPMLKDWLDRLGSVDRFISYYRVACNNPFA